MKSVLNWCYKNLTAKYPGTILALAIILSGVAIYTASGLKYNSKMNNLLPQDLQLVKEFNEVVAKTGGSGPLVVVLEGLGQRQAHQVIDELTTELKKVPGTHFVDSQIPREFLRQRQLLLVPRQDLLRVEALIDDAIEYAREELGGFFGDVEIFNPVELQAFADDYNFFEDISPYHKGKDLQNYYIFVKPKGTVTDTDFTEKFVGAVQQAIERTGLEKKFSGLKIKLTGSLVVRLEENKTILNDLKSSAILAAALAAFILFVYTRSFFSIPLIIFPLLASMTYTFALTQLTIGNLNIISGFLVAILLGLGVDYGIHYYIRFKQELRKGKTIPQAVELVMTQVGRSAVIAMLTTVSVFTVLSFSDFKGFAEFGQIATIGIISAFVTYFFLFPAQILFYDKIHWLRKPRPRLFTLKISPFFSDTPYFVAGLFALLAIASLFLLPGIQFEYDFQKLRGESPAGDYETLTTKDFGYAFSPTVILTPKKENLFYIHQALGEIKKRNGDKTTIGLQYSLNLFSKIEYESKKDILDRIRKRFTDDRDIIELSMGTSRYRKFAKLLDGKPFDEAKVPKNIVKKLTAKDEYLLLLFSPADKNFFDVRNIYQLDSEIDALKKTLEERNIQTAVLNENLLAAEVLDSVLDEGPKSMAIAMAIVFLILVVDLRSVLLAFKTFLPLLTGLALTGALMSVFSVKLNFINIIMLPSIVGIMIDHSVYLAHHILDYSKGGSVKSLQETGSAIILSALTTLAGYVSLNIAHHAGVNSIATLVTIGILTCTVCALFMLPALFELGKRKTAFKP